MLSRPFLVVLVLGALIAADVCDAWRLFRRIKRAVRRIGRKVKAAVKGVGKKICSRVCPKVCRGLGDKVGTSKTKTGGLVTGAVCGLGCTRVCKRSIPDFLNDPNFSVVPMSSDFNHYDLNKDKYITVEEFCRAEWLPREDVRNVYEFVDFDYDGKLDQDEFITAPFVFSAQVAEDLNRRIRAGRIHSIKNGEEPSTNTTEKQLVATAA